VGFFRARPSLLVLKPHKCTLIIETPRDRAGTFEPEIIKKRQTILNARLDNKVLGLFGLGMSYQYIRSHMQEMYGTEVSDGLLSKTVAEFSLYTHYTSRFDSY
jgi:transposase-like protein